MLLYTYVLMTGIGGNTDYIHVSSATSGGWHRISLCSTGILQILFPATVISPESISDLSGFCKEPRKTGRQRSLRLYLLPFLFQKRIFRIEHNVMSAGHFERCSVHIRGHGTCQKQHRFCDLFGICHAAEKIVLQ